MEVKIGSHGLNTPASMDEDAVNTFTSLISFVASKIHENNVAKGFWPDDRNTGEAIALMHSELSEALEAVRDGNPPDDKLPHYDGLTVELADCMIRILDFAAAHNLPVASALIEKMAFNEQRDHKHGKEF